MPSSSPPGAPARPSSPWHRLSRSRYRGLAAAALGAILGAAYAHFIGCRTGTCPLTSSVWTAGLYGAAVGGLAGWPGRDRQRAAPRGRV